MQVTTPSVLTPVNLTVGAEKIQAFVGSSLGYTVTSKTDTQGNSFNLVCLCGGISPKGMTNEAYPQNQWDAYCTDFNGILKKYWKLPIPSEKENVKEMEALKKMNMQWLINKDNPKPIPWGRKKPVRTLVYTPEKGYIQSFTQRNELMQVAIRALKYPLIPSTVVSYTTENRGGGEAMRWEAPTIISSLIDKENTRNQVLKSSLFFLGMDPMKEMKPIEAMINAMINVIISSYSSATQGVKVKGQF